jgi:hypothetical protein
MAANLANTIGVWMAVFFTLAILSFLYKDNPFYKLAEYVYVGLSAGYWLIYVMFFDVKPMIVDKFLQEQGFERYIIIFPAFLGALMLCRMIPRIAYVSRVAIAFTMGISAGLGVTGAIHGMILPQVKATMLPLNDINNVIMLVGVISTVVYFYFSREHKGAFGVAAKVGIIFVMISFGAAFGYTVMARISLLIGRAYFLFHDWLGII